MIAARILTFYYFAHFLIILPVLGWVEKTKPLPNSISEAMLASGQGRAAEDGENIMSRTILALALALALAGSLLGLSPAAAFAAGDAPVPPRQKWSFAGPFGKYDRASCSAASRSIARSAASATASTCLSFRNLDRARLLRRRRSKTIAAEYKIQDGPNDQGDMFERDGRPADRFPPPWPNENAARARYNGVPPDLSVLAKARSYERGFPWFIFDMFTQFQEQGVDYIHALLVGYEEKPPAGLRAAAGLVLQQVLPRPRHRDAAAAHRQAGRLHRRRADHGRPVRQGRHRLHDVGRRAAHWRRASASASR